MAASVASRNYFDLLRDDTQPATTAESKPKETTAPTSAPSKAQGQKGKGGPRGGRYYQRGGAAGSAPRDQPESEEAPREKREDRPRGRGRGGRGRGDRGARPFHGRTYDKHSATGKTDTEKRVESGWGADEGDKELIAEAEGEKDAAAEAPSNDWGVETTAADSWGVPAEPVGDAAAEAAPAESHRKEEEEDNTLTLDQYRNQQDKSNVPQLEGIRKANDGDDALFKDAVVVTKELGEEDTYFAVKAKANKQRNKKDDKKSVISIAIDGQFADTRPPRSGRGRGDRARGNGRGRVARGRGRGGANSSSGAPVNWDDQSAFPSLS